MMLEQISNIGSVLRKLGCGLELVDSVLKDYPLPKNYFVINVTTETQEVYITQYQPDKTAFKNSLYYTKARAFSGAGFYYAKRSSQLSKALSFMEITQNVLIDKITNIVDTEILLTEDAFIELRKDGKKAIELYKNKFVEEKILKERFKPTPFESVCQLCGHFGKNFKTAAYGFYNNDKKTFDCTDGVSFNICSNCLENILNGQAYVKEYLSTYWADGTVIFLPYNFNETIKAIYEFNKEKLLGNIRDKEDMVFEELGKAGALTDIVFYNEHNSEWKIEYLIKDVLPSRFSKIATMLKQNDMTLGRVFSWIEVDGKTKKHQLLNTMFKALSLNRSLFFRQCIHSYHKKYFDPKEKYKRWLIKNLGNVYNFLCELGCLEVGIVNMDYKDTNEVFEKNSNSFNTDEKKAWFLLGRLFREMISAYKKYSSRKSNEAGLTNSTEQSKSSKDSNNKSIPIEKALFLNRKFDKRTFIYISNLCIEKINVYDAMYNKTKELESNIKTLYSNGGSLDADEAKYIFYWGRDIYFKNETEEDVQNG